jgi:hypothetical protein
VANNYAYRFARAGIGPEETEIGDPSKLVSFAIINDN